MDRALAFDKHKLKSQTTLQRDLIEFQMVDTISEKKMVACIPLVLCSKRSSPNSLTTGHVLCPILPLYHLSRETPPHLLWLLCFYNHAVFSLCDIWD